MQVPRPKNKHLFPTNMKKKSTWGLYGPLFVHAITQQNFFQQYFFICIDISSYGNIEEEHLAETNKSLGTTRTNRIGQISGNLTFRQAL